MNAVAHRVLVVDDNADIAEMMSLLLSSAGYDVQTVGDGAAALETAQRFQPSAVLLDLGLPGLDGYEVARRLRADRAFASVLLVALSGYGQDEDRRCSREAGFDTHMVKPVNFDTLLALLDRSLQP